MDHDELVAEIRYALATCARLVDALGPDADVDDLRGRLRRLGRRLDRVADAMTVRQLRRDFRMKTKTGSRTRGSNR